MVLEFYSTYGDLIPKIYKKASEFKSVGSIMVNGMVVHCRYDHINAALDIGKKLNYLNFSTSTTPLDELKRCLDPVISDTTLRWIDSGVWIEKRDSSVAA